MKGLPQMLDIEAYLPFGELTDEKDTILDNWVRVTAWIAKNCAPGKLCDPGI
jgi:adenosylcobinamide hydrolase